MPLRTLLPSSQGLGLTHRRHSTIEEDGPPVANPAPPLVRSRTRGSSLRRLSLTLSRTNEETFPSFLKQDPAVTPQRPSTQPAPAPDPTEPSKNPLPPQISLSKKGEEEQRTNFSDDPNELPLPKPQRLSLLATRYASDPQLSSRFKQEDQKRSPVAVARMCSLLTNEIVVANYSPSLSPQDHHNRTHHQRDGRAYPTIIQTKIVQ